MLLLLLAAQVTSCRPDYIGGFRCSTPPQAPSIVLQPAPQDNTDWGAIFQRIRDNQRAKAVGKLIAAGDCAGAERYAAQRGDLGLAMQIRGYCQSAIAAPAAIAPPRSPEGPLKVRANTRSGFCLDVPPDYVGTGAGNAPAVTSGMPRCSSLHN